MHSPVRFYREAVAVLRHRRRLQQGFLAGVTGLTALSFLGVAALMLVMPLDTADANTGRLSGQEIRSLVTGKRIYIKVPLGGEIPLFYQRNGNVSGSGQAVGLGRYMTPKDTGKWWVRGNQLCQQWTEWYEGRRMCFELERLAGNELLWYRDDGRSGKARISR